LVLAGGRLKKIKYLAIRNKIEFRPGHLFNIRRAVLEKPDFITQGHIPGGYRIDLGCQSVTGLAKLEIFHNPLVAENQLHSQCNIKHTKRTKKNAHPDHNIPLLQPGQNPAFPAQCQGKFKFMQEGGSGPFDTLNIGFFKIPDSGLGGDLLEVIEFFNQVIAHAGCFKIRLQIQNGLQTIEHTGM
jgi:hypothetical protein